MVTCKNSESNAKDRHLIFHLDMFNHGTTMTANYLDKHKKLMEAEILEMLRHPVMMFFTYLKWCPHKKWYFTNFFLFMAFLTFLSVHAYYCINFLQCDQHNKNQTVVELQHQTLCEDKKLKDSGFKVTQFLSCIFLGCLIVWETLQIISKCLVREWKEYFNSIQNLTELLMLSFSVAFFVLEFKELKSQDRSGMQEHFLGWALFLAWLDLTTFLGRFDIFGRHMYRSWHVLKNVFWSLVVYVPVILAFGGAFHCFLRNNPIFKDIPTSVLKSMSMVLGEIELETNFIPDEVEKNHGANWSVQILLVFLIVFGCLIIMNLITAWIVVSQKDDDTEIILAQQRIQEISGMTGFFQNKHQNTTHPNVPAKLCISSLDTASLDKSDDLLSLIGGRKVPGT